MESDFVEADCFENSSSLLFSTSWDVSTSWDALSALVGLGGAYLSLLLLLNRLKEKRVLLESLLSDAVEGEDFFHLLGLSFGVVGGLPEEGDSSLMEFFGDGFDLFDFRGVGILGGVCLSGVVSFLVTDSSCSLKDKDKDDEGGSSRFGSCSSRECPEAAAALECCRAFCTVAILLLGTGGAEDSGRLSFFFCSFVGISKIPLSSLISSILVRE
mmetsp:Transcript_15983/g.22259  ORF Transcript_15983/g.22259 Transcript_15983/m.22259 type:complete len:214 (-) Transcript_15983:552-1193(-)